MNRSPTAIAGYRVTGVLGEGRRSVLYAAENEAGEPRTLKYVYTAKRVDRRGIGYAEREHEIGREPRHDAIRRSFRLIRRRRLLRTYAVVLELEYVPGASLAQKRPDELVELARLFTTWAAALAALHASGYVHTDVKPHNMLFSDEGGPVKLIDFEHAWPRGRAKPWLQGTETYAAPEQMALEPLEPTADVFAFGVSLYWAITGELPPNPGAPAHVGTRRGTVRPVETYRPGTPPGLSRLVMACLEPRAANRPSCMQEVRDRLDLARRHLSESQDA